MKLTFRDDRFDAVICLNGDLPRRNEFTHFADLPLIAADGAANALFANDIGPEFIIGDLDSVDRASLDLFRSTSEIIHDHDQDSNDFEKTLRFAESQLWRRLLILGLHGGDLEHTLNNWSVLMRHGRTLSLTAFDRDRYAIPMFHSFAFTAQHNELISLIPQPLATLTTRGLQWELDNEGARNRAIGSGDERDESAEIEVDIHEGSLLFFCDARLPMPPLLA
jgi:thiamine pyrophosphokinase